MLTELEHVKKVMETLGGGGEAVEADLCRYCR